MKRNSIVLATFIVGLFSAWFNNDIAFAVANNNTQVQPNLITDNQAQTPVPDITELQNIPDSLVNPTPFIQFMSEKRITLATYTMGVSQTKDLANRMNSISGISANVISALLGFIPIYGGAASLAYSLSASAANKSVVQRAAAQGKKLRVRVTDNAYYHTSYSLQYEYSIV
ncbi:hypothetical protein ACNAN0_00060 [Agrilactobacillus fermenti]|uniref:hypothetical protein n=1 Tax=Agrilactobacillus fermenti TaxID=2586909 RepID=UPI001E632C5F|nr:hypothetical protein [Agrilactobacillus fermenti]MCD2256111.1 hypothetical protein [Agrilactobacillus fermenti]